MITCQMKSIMQSYEWGAKDQSQIEYRNWVLYFESVKREQPNDIQFNKVIIRFSGLIFKPYFSYFKKCTIFMLKSNGLFPL